MRKAVVLVLLSLLEVVCLFGQEPRIDAEVRASDTSPLVLLRTSDEIVDRGDRMRVWFETAHDVHAIVFRIDTDGRVRMLFPERPWHDNFVHAGNTVEVKNSACGQFDCAFVVDDYPGQGYIFAIVSTVPFELGSYANGDYWAYSNIAHLGRVTGDPFRAMSKLMERLVPEPNEGTHSYDVFVYHVEQHFAYPRFICYECHSFARFSAWNPYQRECTRFRIVSYDSPAYQAASGYSATRVVFSRPRQVEPRFVFTERVAGEPYFSVERERFHVGTVDTGREAGAAAREVGGLGMVPAPLGRRRTLSEKELRRLSPPSLRGTSATARPQPRLIRRRKAKPDTSGKRVRTKPDTSGSARSWNPNEI